MTDFSTKLREFVHALGDGIASRRDTLTVCALVDALPGPLRWEVRNDWAGGTAEQLLVGKSPVPVAFLWWGPKLDDSSGFEVRSSYVGRMALAFQPLRAK